MKNMKLALAYSDFKEFIDDITTKVSVITRPRRFGKTLNLSMLMRKVFRS
ncbi:MAG: AAA family ATPase [Oligoflexia bacterium]|nr:AAA family ATPase [Oligoflexia bacterium]